MSDLCSAPRRRGLLGYGLLRGSWGKAFWVFLAYIIVWAPQRIDEALTAWKNRK
jgi:hypothetical protein